MLRVVRVLTQLQKLVCTGIPVGKVHDCILPSVNRAKLVQDKILLLSFLRSLFEAPSHTLFKAERCVTIKGHLAISDWLGVTCTPIIVHRWFWPEH